LRRRPNDPEYLRLLASAKDEHNHTQDAFIFYLDVGNLALRFGIGRLESWARLQLSLVLRSADRLADSKWDKDTLLQVVSYGNEAPGDDTPNFPYGMISFVYLVLSISTGNPLVPGEHFGLNLDTCVRLFMDPSLPESLPDLFGYLFAIILSLDHQSSVWKTDLTRNHRAILYAAQVQLTRLDQHAQLTLDWLVSPQKAATSRICGPCGRRFKPLWGASFGKLGALGSAVPSEDIATIILLPQCRQMFAKAVQSEVEVCKSRCGEKTLYSVDQHIHYMFSELESEYQRLVE
jgi:hypothetical protein